MSGDTDLIAPLLALAEAGIPADIQELLVHGNPLRGIAPGALAKALEASDADTVRVPREPTEAMQRAGWAVVDPSEPEHWDVAGKVWAAMLTASHPKPEPVETLSHDERVRYEQQILALEMDIERLKKGEQPIYAGMTATEIGMGTYHPGDEA